MGSFGSGSGGRGDFSGQLQGLLSTGSSLGVGRGVESLLRGAWEVAPVQCPRVAWRPSSATGRPFSREHRLSLLGLGRGSVPAFSPASHGHRRGRASVDVSQVGTGRGARVSSV